LSFAIRYQEPATGKSIANAFSEKWSSGTVERFPQET
jgi:hypothetical protein